MRRECPWGYSKSARYARIWLYQMVERHYAELAAVREATGRPLPRSVQEEFEAYLKCGRLEYGFLRVCCEDCHAEKLIAFSCIAPRLLSLLRHSADDGQRRAACGRGVTGRGGGADGFARGAGSAAGVAVLIRLFVGGLALAWRPSK
jgi:hypothetical protein